MNFRKAVWRLGCGLGFLGALYAFQRPFRQFPGIEYRPRRHSPAARLSGKDRVGLRPPDVPARPAQRISRPRRRLAHRLLPLVAGFPARRPPFFAGRAAADPHPRALRGAGGQPRRGRRLRLAVAVCRAGGRVGTDRQAGAGVARIPAARRLLHGRRLPRQRGMVRVRIADQEGISRRRRFARSRTTTRSSTRCTT